MNSQCPTDIHYRRKVLPFESRRTRMVSIVMSQVRPLVGLIENSLLDEPHHVSQIVSFRKRKTEIETSSWELVLRAEIGFDSAVTVKIILPRRNYPVIHYLQLYSETKLLYRVGGLRKHTHTINLNLIWLPTSTAGVGYIRKQVLKCYQRKEDCSRCGRRCVANRWMEITHHKKSYFKI